MKASVSYKTLDNITVVLLAFKNFKKALTEEYNATNNLTSMNSKRCSTDDSALKESGPVLSNFHNESEE